MKIPPYVQYIAIGFVVALLIFAIGYFNSTKDVTSILPAETQKPLFSEEIDNLNVEIEKVEGFTSNSDMHKIVKTINENLSLNVKISNISEDLLKMLKGIQVSEVELYEVSSGATKSSKTALSLIESDTNLADLQDSGVVKNGNVYTFTKSFSYKDLFPNTDPENILFYSKSDTDFNKIKLQFVPNYEGANTIEKEVNVLMMPSEVPIPPDVLPANDVQLTLSLNSINDSIQADISTNAYYEYRVGNSAENQPEKLSFRYDSSVNGVNLYNLYTGDNSTINRLKVERSLLDPALAFFTSEENGQLRVLHKNGNAFVLEDSYKPENVVYLVLSDDVAPPQMIPSSKSSIPGSSKTTAIQKYYMYHDGNKYIGTNSRQVSSKTVSATQDQWFSIIKQSIKDADLSLEPRGDHFIIRNARGKNAKGIQFDGKNFYNSGYSSSTNGRYVRLIAV